MIIEKITADSLFLRKNDLSISFFRNENPLHSKKEETVKEETVKGTLVLGHEVRSFTAEGDSVAYWISDPSGQLSDEYDKITGGQKNGQPVYVELNVIKRGPSSEGFAKNYAGVYELVKTLQIKALD